MAASNGAQIPLSQVARIEHTRGPAMISSENGLLIATVLAFFLATGLAAFTDRQAGTIVKVDRDENLRMIEESIAFLRAEDPATRNARLQLSAATRAVGSCSRIASSTASEI